MKRFVAIITVSSFFSVFGVSVDFRNAENEKKITKIIQEVTGHKEGDCFCLLEDIALNGSEKSLKALLQIWEEKLDPELPILTVSALHSKEIEFKEESMKQRLSSLDGIDEAYALYLKIQEVTSTPEFIEQSKKIEAEEKAKEEARKKEIEAEEQKKAEYASYKASMDDAKKKKEEKIREVLSKYRGKRIWARASEFESDAFGVYSTCFYRYISDFDSDCEESIRTLLKEGIVPSGFISSLVPDAIEIIVGKMRAPSILEKSISENHGNVRVRAAKFLCEFWENQDLFSTLICESTQNGSSYFRFLKYLLFEEKPEVSKILECFSIYEDMFKIEDALHRTFKNPFSIYEDMFPKILEEAKKGNPRCLEHLFCLKYNAMGEPERYASFWKIVESNKELLDSIVKYKLSILEKQGIRVSKEYLGFH